MSEKKVKKNIVAGIVHVYSSFNNTIITIADQSGNTIVWDSSGTQGFKGAKKATPYAAQKAAESAARKAFEHGVRTVDVLVKGPGAGKEQAILGIKSAGITIKLIRDVTSYPFNGVRPRKKRRV